MPQIQEMLDKIPTPLSGATCNEKTGWLPPNFDDNCRAILTRTIDQLLEAQPPDFDLSSANAPKKSENNEANEEAEAEAEWPNEDENDVSIHTVVEELIECQLLFFFFES